MWNAISLVQDLTRVTVSISSDDNHYTTGTTFQAIGFDKLSSTPKRGCLCFISWKYPMGTYFSSFHTYEEIVRLIGLFNFDMKTDLGEEKNLNIFKKLRSIIWEHL